MSRDRAALRAHFLRAHPARSVARAEALALLHLAAVVLELATQRRESAQRAYLAAVDEAEERPEEARVDGVPVRFRERDKSGALPNYPGTFRAYTWRALERLADAAATEVEWSETAAGCARRLAGLSPPRAREIVTYGNDGARRVLFRETDI